MNRLQQLQAEGSPVLMEQELSRLNAAIKQENGKIRMTMTGDFTSSAFGAATVAPKRPWVAALAFLTLGLWSLAVSFGPTPVTDRSGHLIRMMPFNAYNLLAGLLFAPAGYWLLCGVSELILDPKSREWTLRRGIAPFVMARSGVVDTAARWEMVVATRRGKTNTRKSDYGMWTLRLVGVPRPAPSFTEFKSFDLQPGIVDHDTALLAYGRIAEQTGVPIIDATLAGAVEEGNVEKLETDLSGLLDTDRHSSTVTSITQTIGDF